MPQCVAFNCTNQAGKGLAMFTFPKDQNKSRIWTEKLKRKNFVPTAHSRLCEKHFLDSDFVISRTFAASVEFNKDFRLRLRDGAVPSVFDFSSPPPRKSSAAKELPAPSPAGPSPAPSAKRPRISTAVKKRNKLQV